MTVSKMAVRSLLNELELNTSSAKTKKALRAAEKAASLEEAKKILLAMGELKKFDKFAHTLACARKWHNQIATAAELSEGSGDLFADAAMMKTEATAEEAAVDKARRNLALCKAWLDSHPRTMSGYTL